MQQRGGAQYGSPDDMRAASARNNALNTRYRILALVFILGILITLFLG